MGNLVQKISKYDLIISFYSCLGDDSCEYVVRKTKALVVMLINVIFRLRFISSFEIQSSCRVIFIS